MKTEDIEVLGKQRAKLSKIKARYSRPTCKNCLYLVNIITVHNNTVTGFPQYSPSSRPTSHLRRGQVEVRWVATWEI